ncbi:hypothetical protein FK220_009275 [Flavobacteriaceae bacterium TP-CH-4]|uniref:Uncharacterized protein n=1 Tax=Pelagihabitans pacificus TaxID=2696054 RepID=A0A967AZT2_9FLAO|nr:hypothetical protein [Pelagihabitans pacificus]NHF59531.1 hypothetical protein [Pelagihabitans pacificus]
MCTDSILGVIFFTRKKRNNPERLDIYVRITVNKQRAELCINRCTLADFQYESKPIGLWPLNVWG